MYHSTIGLTKGTNKMSEPRERLLRKHNAKTPAEHLQYLLGVSQKTERWLRDLAEQADSAAMNYRLMAEQIADAVSHVARPAPAEE